MKLPIVVTLALSYFLMACSGTDSVTGPYARPFPPGGSDPLTNTLIFSGVGSVLDPGESVTVAVTAMTADGRIVNDGVVTWQSSDPKIASVNSTGNRTAKLTAVGFGSAVIFAELGGTANSVGVHVRSATETAGQIEGTTGSFIYSAEAGMEFFRIPIGSTAIEATAINDAGQVVGTLTHQNGSRHAFVWSRTTGVVEFLDGRSYSSATAISSNGQIAGFVDGSDGMHSFIWSAQLGMRDLGAPDTYAMGINSSGVVVGWRLDHTLNERQAFKWTEAAGFDSRDTYAVHGVATAVNDAGEIAGWLTDGDFDYTGAVYWSATGASTVIPCNAAFAINKDGAIAGRDNGRPFTWSVGTRCVPLQGVANGYSDARAINDRGTVAGNVYKSEFFNGQSINQNFAFVRTADGHYYEIFAPRGRASLRMTGMNNNEQVVGVVQ